MKTKTAFAPMLAIDNGITDISFYKNAFNAVQHFCLRNDDGSIHVAELSIDEAVFHIHEITQHTGLAATASTKGGTVTIGLMVDDVHTVFDHALAAGAKLVTPVTDYDYGYRQGEITDPFGHRWVIEKKI